MAGRADGLNDIFDENVTIKKNLNTNSGQVNKTPTNDLDIANKKYVDDNVGGLDWTVSQAPTVIHQDNYVDNDTTDHTLLSNIGTNTHAQIDTHIADTTIHFTQGDISITESQISDLDHYTSSDFNTDFSAKSTTDLTEGTNLYFTDARAVSAVSTADDYLKNDGDTATGNYNFDSGTFYIDATNNRVGIGTTSPSAKLHIDETTELQNTVGAEVLKVRMRNDILGGSINYFDVLGYRENTTSSTSWINSGTRLRSSIDDNASANAWIDFIHGSSPTDNMIRFGEGDTNEWMRIDNGNVGIGTTSPQKGLHIVGNYNSVLQRLERTGSATGIYDIGVSDVGLQFWAGGYASDYADVCFDQSGNVGIGTTSPSYKLDVSGQARFTKGRHPTNSLHGSSYTANDIFDALSPSIPNTNDEIIVTGGFEDYIISKAKRYSSTRIDLYGIKYDGTAVATWQMTDSSGSSYTCSLSW